MRLWYGRTRLRDAGIGFRWPTLHSSGPDRTALQWWPIRRIFGVIFGRVLVTVIVVDKVEWQTVAHATRNGTSVDEVASHG
jgi:hypothetical protein